MAVSRAPSRRFHGHTSDCPACGREVRALEALTQAFAPHPAPGRAGRATPPARADTAIAAFDAGLVAPARRPGATLRSSGPPPPFLSRPPSSRRARRPEHRRRAEHARPGRCRDHLVEADGRSSRDDSSRTRGAGDPRRPRAPAHQVDRRAARRRAGRHRDDVHGQRCRRPDHAGGGRGRERPVAPARPRAGGDRAS